MPKRVQMTRQKPWRADNPDAVVVARPSKWGNPFKVGDRSYGLVRFGPKHHERFGRDWDYEGRCSGPGSHDMWFSSDDIVETYIRKATRTEVVELFRLTIIDPTPGMRMAYPSGSGRLVKFTVEDVRTELAGHDLACWCKPSEECHADVLLEIANQESSNER